MDNTVIDFDKVNSSFRDIELLPDTLPPVEKFDYHLLPDGAFAEHVRDISERMQCAPDFVASALMTVLGSVIGRSHQIRPKQYDDWVVVPNLWGIAIASPSQLKSPAVESSLSHVRRLDIESKERFDAEMKTYECDKEFQKAERDQTRKDVAIFLKQKKRDEARALLESQEEIESPVRRRRYTNDSTIEKLGELLVQNSNGMLIYRDEIHGFLKTIDSESRPNDRAFYLEGWNGTGSYQSDRIGRGTTDIKHHVISLFGTIQPGRIASYIHNAVRQGSGDDGFSQRFQLAVYPDELGKWRNVDRYPNNEAKNEVYATIQKLAGMAETTEPVVLQFSSEAQTVFNEWRDELENNKLRNTDDHPSLIAHLAKYRSLLPSLALVIHLVDTCDTEITAVSEMATIKACGWCDYLESHARRIYADATNNPLKTAKLILNKIKGGKLPNGFNPREINRKCWSGLTDTAEVKEGIETLIDYGYLLECVIETTGRPAVTYRIHPDIMEGVHNG
jgi:putative DNA primase/helicase